MKAIYKKNDPVSGAYLLKSGRIYMDVLGDHYSIEGTNLIVGSVEVILGYKSNIPQFRYCSMYMDEDSVLEAVHADTLKGLIHRYNIGFNLNTFLAKTLLILNKIQGNLKTEVMRDENVVNQRAGSYYELVRFIDDLAQKLNFSDLVKLAKNAKEELFYEAGKQISKKEATYFKVEKDAPVNQSIKSGTILCKQDEESNEMFILNQGAIGVEINDFEVAEINESGTVIGEIALFLREKRTATLRAKTDLAVAVLRKENLVDFTQAYKNFFFTVAASLANKIRQYFLAIKYLQNEKENLPPSGEIQNQQGVKELAKLSKAIFLIWKRKKYPQLEPLMQKYKSLINEYMKKAE